MRNLNTVLVTAAHWNLELCCVLDATTVDIHVGAAMEVKVRRTVLEECTEEAYDVLARIWVFIFCKGYFRHYTELEKSRQ